MQPMKTSAKQSVFSPPHSRSEYLLIVARTQWEVEVGKRYEPIVTTRDGLWRYRLGDIVHIVGFHPESNSPLFKCVGRRVSVFTTRTHQVQPLMIGLGQVYTSLPVRTDHR